MPSSEGEPLTVLMPVRNGALDVESAIADLAQSLDPDDELLIIDDGSTDATPSILDREANAEPRIRVITTEGLGLVEALNLGIREAQWSWLARADADDRYPVDRLTRQRAARSADVVAITGDYEITGPQRATRIPCALGAPFVALSLIHPQRFPHPGVLIHRDAVTEAGGYRREEYPAEDLGLWLRLARVGKFVGVPSVVVRWRMNVTSVTHTSQVEQRTMTAALLKSFSFPQAAAVTARDLEEELARYEGTPQADERAVLLARDLWAARSLGVSRSMIGTVVQRLSSHPISSARALITLSNDASIREQYRESLGC